MWRGRLSTHSDPLEWLNDVNLLLEWQGINQMFIRGGVVMSWRYSAPQRCDFDSEEDYQEAMIYYEDAADLYADEYFERSRN